MEETVKKSKSLWYLDLDWKFTLSTTCFDDLYIFNFWQASGLIDRTETNCPIVFGHDKTMFRVIAPEDLC